MAERQVSAIYHDPPVWVGSPVIRYNHGDREALAVLREEEYRGEVAGSVPLMVSREGVFAFDFEHWAPGQMPSRSDDAPIPFEEWARLLLNRTLVINSFLAFLYTRCAQHERFALERMVATPELLISMSSLSTNSDQGYGNQRVAHLALSSYQSTYLPGLPVMADSRLSMRHFSIPVDAIGHAEESLSRLIAEHGELGLLLVDLFLRASKAFQDHNHSAALINYWAISERLLQEMWQEFQGRKKTQAGEVVIDKRRRARLNDGRTFTAAVITEILTFDGLITHDLYGEIAKVRKIRNDWLHGLKGTVVASDAQTAANVCQALLRIVLDVELLGHTGLRLHG